jgi:hypothetical protein
VSELWAVRALAIPSAKGAASMSNVEKLISECLRERLPDLVGTAMAQGDIDVAGEALSWHALITGETGFLKRAGQRDWRNALDVVNTGIDSAVSKHGPYYKWTKARKQLFGYMLGFFYLMQAVSLAECNRIDDALNTSIPRALAVEEASPILRAAIREFKEQLTTIQGSKKAR